MLSPIFAPSQHINCIRNKYLTKHPTEKGMILHHPYGRIGGNIKYYYAVTVEEHKMIHHQLGYGRGNGGFWQPKDWFNL